MPSIPAILRCVCACLSPCCSLLRLFHSRFPSILLFQNSLIAVMRSFINVRIGQHFNYDLDDVHTSIVNVSFNVQNPNTEILDKR